MKILTAPISKEVILKLKERDIVLLTGTIFTARDAAHKRILNHLDKHGEMLLKGQTIYYAGPCPPKSGEIIGSIGPTTSYRMDTFVPKFLDNGIFATIGKGERSENVKIAIKRNGGIHLSAIGGAGAFYKSCIQDAQLMYFEDLGTEAVYKLQIKNFPCIVTIV